MLTVTAALELIVKSVQPFEISRIPLENAQGLTLAQSVNSSTDLPAFDKSIVDGYAVISSDLDQGLVTLRIIDVVTAGNVSSRRVQSGEAIQIMTGAPLPDGADAVVKVEDTKREAQEVSIKIGRAHV